jgi:hypothetical protein
MSVKQLLKMTVRAAQHDQGFGGKAELTSSDIAAALSYCNFTDFEYRYLSAVFLQSEPYGHGTDLDRSAYLWVVGIANDHGWDVVPGKPVLRTLAEICIEERINPRLVLCKYCCGTGVRKDKHGQPKQCNHCDGEKDDEFSRTAIGNGVKRKSNRHYASRLDIDHKTYSSKWSERKDIITSALITIENKIRYLRHAVID